MTGTDWDGPTEADLPEDGNSTSDTPETRMFNMNWENDYTLYHAVLGYARNLLRREPDMDDEELGENVITTVREWCEAAQDPDGLLAIMRRDVGDFDAVVPASVAENVRYGLGVE